MRSVQCPGGCGALRLGAELIRLAAPQAVVHVSTPTWANHVPLLSGSGLKLEPYPYFDPATGGVQFEAMTAALERLPPRAVVLLHASCHNPTGADLSQEQWRALLALVKRRQLVPFIDMAYQGLGESLDADAFAIRLFCAELPEVLCAVSCSKNFGLYRERAGSLHVINDEHAGRGRDLEPAGAHRRAASGRCRRITARRSCARILADATPARSCGTEELTEMRARIQDLRHAVVWQLREHCPQRDFGFIAAQRGMFSFFGISTAQVRALRERHHVYMTDDSRINVAGLRRENLEYFARAVAQVLAA